MLAWMIIICSGYMLGLETDIGRIYLNADPVYLVPAAQVK